MSRLDGSRATDGAPDSLLPPAAAASLWCELTEGRRRVLAVADVNGERHVWIALDEVGDSLNWACLSTRERAIVGLAADDVSQKQIAAELGVSVATVCGTLRRTRAKLSFTHTAQLARAYAAHRLRQRRDD